MAITGPNGDYRFDNLPGPATFTLSASYSGYYFNPITNTLRPTQTYNFSGAANRYAVTVIVKKIDGTPQKNVILDGGQWGTAVSDAQGRGSLMIDYGQPYTIYPRHDFYDFNTEILTGQVWGAVDRVIIGQEKER
jgi:hypothetical protein